MQVSIGRERQDTMNIHTSGMSESNTGPPNAVVSLDEVEPNTILAYAPYEAPYAPTLIVELVCY